MLKFLIHLFGGLTKDEANELALDRADAIRDALLNTKALDLSSAETQVTELNAAADMSDDLAAELRNKIYELQRQLNIHVSASEIARDDAATISRSVVLLRNLLG